MMTILARMVLITGAKYIFLNTQSYITGFIVRAPASVEVLRYLNVKIQWCCCVHKFICIAGGGRKKGFQSGEMVWDGLSGRVPDKDGSHHNAWQDARMAILGSHQGVVHLSYRAERWRPRGLCCALCFGVVGTRCPMFRSPAFVAPPLPRSYYWGWGEQSQRAIHFFQNRDGKQLNCRDKIEDMFLIFNNY